MIDEAAAILRAGGLVAFPTETVYGLGADATNAAAVRRIFEAKGRPSTNPLIVHVADVEAAMRFAAEWSPVAQQLADRFWPGPLTLVVAKAPVIVDEVTAGLQTVGLRVPDHPLALELLRAFGGAVAAPSANRSNRVSPTSADHVRDELGDRIDLVLDGGNCTVGIESTVLDLTRSTPTILRPGGVPREQIEAVIGPVGLATAIAPTDHAAASPGQHTVHYAPTTPAFRFEPDDWPRVVAAINGGPRNSTVVMFVGGRGRYRKLWPGERGKPHTFLWREVLGGSTYYAQILYAALRGYDEQGLRAIFIEMPPDEPEWLAVRDRIRRATRPLPA